ncbi:uncharacterized protein LOC135209014 [Macrobrachium nipponense]|uniref:uncharacterized protein LOC135209014 n=1 Tax=Macrobrachium nipponense TaxID=159736 RepID=UPI0030C8A54D
MIQEMYRNVYTRVTSSVGETDEFEIGVGLHQGSALSPFISNIVMNVMTRDVREAVPGITEDGGSSIRLGGEEIKKGQRFKYLGSVLEDSGSMDQELRASPDYLINQGILSDDKEVQTQRNAVGILRPVPVDIELEKIRLQLQMEKETAESEHTLKKDAAKQEFALKKEANKLELSPENEKQSSTPE